MQRKGKKMANYDLLNQEEKPETFIPETLLVTDMHVSDLKKLIIECLKEIRDSCVDEKDTNPQNVRYGGNKRIGGDEIGH